MMLIQEAHSSDLTANCLRAVQLRHLGKVVGTMPGALYRGLLAGEALSILHNRKSFDDISSAMQEAIDKVIRQSVDERRPLTQAVKDKQGEIHAEVAEALGHYRDQVWPMFESSELIGTEVPIRFTLDVDGEPMDFASHLDLMFRDATGQCHVWDWKFREQTSAPYSYLSRNLQLGMYFLAVAEGEIGFSNGEFWETLGEMAEVAWIDLPNLFPYSRKTTTKDDAGNEVTFVKGDRRPINKIVRRINFQPEHLDTIKAELSLRVRMMRLDMWPTNPSESCEYCDSQRFCPTFTTQTQP